MLVHRLAERHADSGLTKDERLHYAVEQFKQMPLIVQQQILDDLCRIVADLPDLHPMVVAAVNEAKQAAAKTIQLKVS